MALSVQVPMVSMVTTAPLVPPVVHTAVVALEKTTGLVDAPAVAFNAMVVAPTPLENGTGVAGEVAKLVMA